PPPRTHASMPASKAASATRAATSRTSSEWPRSSTPRSRRSVRNPGWPKRGKRLPGTSIIPRRRYLPPPRTTRRAWPDGATWWRARPSARACCCARRERSTAAPPPLSLPPFPVATPGRAASPSCAMPASMPRRGHARARPRWKPSTRRKPRSTKPGTTRMPHEAPTVADCAREPIHLSGAIQPHGYLVSCELPGWTIRQVSANAEALFGVPAADLPGQSLREHVAGDVLDPLEDTAAYLDAGAAAQRVGAANIGVHGALCDLSVHVSEGLVHVEAEPLARFDGNATPTAVAQAMIARLGSGDDDAGFLEAVAGQVRQLSGYDRVMVYRFREDDAGEVIAESLADGLEPYLGLRYPASDIPPQARALYLRNRIRVIPDAGYAPVPVLPGVLASGEPLDLSQVALRSVSPVHLEYLRNMGVAASMSISIVSGGRLWGLVACHHREPRLVPPAMRAALDLFGMFVSMRVSAREQEQAMAGQARAERIREQLRRNLAGASDFNAALAGELDMLK